VRFCFAFPDVYEVGISHLGLKILYTIVNDLTYAMADRTYLPWLDALQLMKQDGSSLFALESKQPVSSFDIVGITLQSELTFTNILELLDVSGIPVHAKDRADSHPIVIAGGPCASNPLPIQPFIDAFLMGEGEDAIIEIAEAVQAYKLNRNSGLQRRDLLAKLAQIPGMYVPAVHDLQLNSNPNLRIRIRKYAAFKENIKTHTPQLMPWQLATHNRYTAEIMRGCTRGCRFCHAGYFYRPVRERSPEAILDDLLQEVEAYGWEEAGLVSLSSSDYTCIRPLLEALLKMTDPDKTHISLPSLRVDSLDDTLVSLLRELGREGLTIAPEAGSQRLRNVINKNLSEAEILAGVRIARELGWQKIKLYFMLGLPTETDSDIDGIIELMQKIMAEAGKRFQINVSLSPFVPKAHTPFQWSAMLNGDELLRRAIKIKNAFQRYRFIKVRYHTIESSMLEAVISRGDGKTAAWIEQAWKLGAIYDGWNEGFNWQHWTDAALAIGYNYETVFQELNPSDSLPWDFIDLGVDKAWLQQEWQQAQNEKTSADCREDCLGCGVCDEQNKMQTTQTGSELVNKLAVLPIPAPQVHPGTTTVFIKNWIYRLTYRKGGDFRFIGHLDWMRMVFRMMGRSKLPIVYTQGFNPHPKISFGPSLGVGITGEREYLQMYLSEQLKVEDISAALKPLLSGGIELVEIAALNGKQDEIQPISDILLAQVPRRLIEGTRQRLAHVESALSLSFTKQKKDSERTYDLKTVIQSVTLEDDRLKIVKQLQSPNVYDLLAVLLDVDKEELYDWEISRTGFVWTE
jgi:radical SAM family uncharacterized protein/radical SAM-linked protein